MPWELLLNCPRPPSSSFFLRPNLLFRGCANQKHHQQVPNNFLGNIFSGIRYKQNHGQIPKEIVKIINYTRNNLKESLLSHFISPFHLVNDLFKEAIKLPYSLAVCLLPPSSLTKILILSLKRMRPNRSPNLPLFFVNKKKHKQSTSMLINFMLHEMVGKASDRNYSYAAIFSNLNSLYKLKNSLDKYQT